MKTLKSTLIKIPNSKSSKLSKLQFISYCVWWCFLSLFSTSAINAQTSSAAAAAQLLNLYGVPSNSTIESAYRVDKEQYYIYAEGTKFEDLSDLDVVYLKAAQSSIRYGVGKSNSDSIFLIHKIVNPSTEFMPWQEKISHTLFLNGNIETYGINNRHISTKLLDSTSFLIDDIPFGNEINLILRPNGMYYMREGDFEMMVDSTNRIVFIKMEHEGISLQTMELYELNSDNAWRLKNRISSIPDKTPTGLCVFFIEEENYTDYYDQTIQLKEDKTNPNTIKNFDLKLNPNPTYNGVNLNITGVEQESEVSIQIFTMTGETIFLDTQKGDNSKYIDLSSYPSGIYLLVARSNNTTISQKIIKK